jgi:hypothetical protein
LGIEEGHAEHHGDGRQKKENVAVDEIERVETEPACHWRACRKRKHDAGQHQRADGGKRQPVDRPPPFAEEACVARAKASLSPRPAQG